MQEGLENTYPSEVGLENTLGLGISSPTCPAFWPSQMMISDEHLHHLKTHMCHATAASYLECHGRSGQYSPSFPQGCNCWGRCYNVHHEGSGRAAGGNIKPQQEEGARLIAARQRLSDSAPVQRFSHTVPLSLPAFPRHVSPCHHPATRPAGDIQTRIRLTVYSALRPGTHCGAGDLTIRRPAM